MPEVSKPELSKEVSKSEDQPEVKTEVKPEPETTKKETKTATEVPEPSGIEPFKETYFDEDNHVVYYMKIDPSNRLLHICKHDRTREIP